MTGGGGGEYDGVHSFSRRNSGRTKDFEDERMASAEPVRNASRIREDTQTLQCSTLSFRKVGGRPQASQRAENDGGWV